MRIFQNFYIVLICLQRAKIAFSCELRNEITTDKQSVDAGLKISISKYFDNSLNFKKLFRKVSALVDKNEDKPVEE